MATAVWACIAMYIALVVAGMKEAPFRGAKTSPRRAFDLVYVTPKAYAVPPRHLLILPTCSQHFACNLGRHIRPRGTRTSLC